MLNTLVIAFAKVNNFNKNKTNGSVFFPFFIIFFR